MKTIWIFLFSMFLSSLANAGFVGFVDSPKGCYSLRTYPCQLRVSGGFLTIEREAQVLQLADQAAVSFLSANEIQFLGGTSWVRKSQDLKVRISPLLSLQVTGEFFFRRQADASMLVRNLGGEVEFHSDRVFASEALPVGFQNWYGPLDANGKISRGMIRPMDMNAFLKDWYVMSGLSVAEMKNRVQEYREAWKDGLDLSVELYSQVASRRIASVEERERKKWERRQAAERERQKIRNMYRNRNGLGAENSPSF